MVEVFKTNVIHFEEAQKLLELIHCRFKTYSCNFDLEDCDCVLRVETKNSIIETKVIIKFLCDRGYEVEILNDDC